VQLGTISVIKGDLLEYASNPDWVEQQLNVKIKITVREKARNVLKICSGETEVPTAVEIPPEGSHDPRPWSFLHFNYCQKFAWR
jgi:hypothetical protein